MSESGPIESVNVPKPSRLEPPGGPRREPPAVGARPEPGHVPAPEPPVIARSTVYADIDELEKTPLKPKIENTSNFAKSTEVIYVNGIGTDTPTAKIEGQQYADLTHHQVVLMHDQTHGQGLGPMSKVFGKVIDVGIAVLEANVPGFAEAGRPEQILAAELLEKAGRGHDVHLAAFSRGALITEKAIALADGILLAEGKSPAYVRDVFHARITLETFNGASHDVADGIRAVHYVNTKDQVVGNSDGFGPYAPLERTAAESLLGPGVATTYMLTEGIANKPNGPVIMVDAGTTNDPIANHAVHLILESKQYQAFENAFAPYAGSERDRLSIHPVPTTMAPPIAQLHVFSGNAEHLVASGYERSGKLFDYGNFVGQVSQKNGHDEVTMYSKEELMNAVAPQSRAALREAIAHGTSVDISLQHDALTVHSSASPSRSVAPERAHVNTRSDSGHHELGR